MLDLKNNFNFNSLSHCFYQDKKILAWTCWCTSLAFNDYSYEEMLQFIKETDNEKLAELIETYKISNTPFSLSPGLLNVIKLPGKNEILSLDLNFNNPLIEDNFELLTSYCLEQNQNLNDWYFNHLDNDLTLNTMNVFIFPLSPKKDNNSIITAETQNTQRTVSFENETDNRSTALNQNLICLLGNPEKLAPLTQENKQGYLILLLDCLFSFKGNINIKEEILTNQFGLSSFITKRILTDIDALKEIFRDDLNK